MVIFFINNSLRSTFYPQWRIQDFPGGANSQSGCANLFFAENCIKTKEFEPRGRIPGAPPGSAKDPFEKIGKHV